MTGINELRKGQVWQNREHPAVKVTLLGKHDIATTNWWQIDLGGTTCSIKEGFLILKYKLIKDTK